MAAPLTLAVYKQAIDATADAWYQAVLKEPSRHNYDLWSAETRRLWDVSQRAVELAAASIPHRQGLVDKVKAHALAHYNDGGWDVVVETMTDFDIALMIEGAETIGQAVAAFGDAVSIWADAEADAVNSAF